MSIEHLNTWFQGLAPHAVSMNPKKWYFLGLKEIWSPLRWIPMWAQIGRFHWFSRTFKLYFTSRISRLSRLDVPGALQMVKIMFSIYCPFNSLCGARFSWMQFNKYLHHTKRLHDEFLSTGFDSLLSFANGGITTFICFGIAYSRVYIWFCRMHA